MIKDKDAYSIDDNITINVKFSLGGDIRNSFNEKNWTDAWNNNDNQFKLKYGVKLNSGGLRKHDVGKPIDTYRKASIFWTRNPKLVNPVKKKRIWVQVAKNFEPYIKLTEEDVQKELFDFDESIVFTASELGKGNSGEEFGTKAITVHHGNSEVFLSPRRPTVLKKRPVISLAVIVANEPKSSWSQENQKCR